MDFQDFLIEFVQDYGTVIVPLGVMGLMYILSQLTAKRTSQQFGLGQATATMTAEDKPTMRKRQAANHDMHAEAKQQPQRDEAASTTEAHAPANSLYDDELDDENDYHDDGHAGYDAQDDSDDDMDEDDYYHNESSEEEDDEAYGEYIDDRFNQQKATIKADAAQNLRPVSTKMPRRRID